MAIANCASASELLGARGALDSMSTKELFALFVFLLTRGVATDDVLSIGDVCTELNALKTSTVDLAGLPKKQWMASMVSALPDSWWAVDGVQLTVSQMRSYLCCTRCLTEDQLRGILLYLTCRVSTQFTITPA